MPIPGAMSFFLWVWALLGQHKAPKHTHEAPKPTPHVPGPPEPWPQVVPEGLPPFPSKGWVPDEPPSAGVMARARQLLPVLWAHGIGAHKTEMTGGRWITYDAALHRDKRAVEAWHLAEEPPVIVTPPAPIPHPAPAPHPTPHHAPAPAPAPTPEPEPPPPPEPAPEPIPNARRELAARLATSLAGVAKGHEDQGLVAEYEQAAGIVETGAHPMYGPTVGYSLAKDGVVPPSPLYWPKDWSRANQAIKDWKAFCARQAALETDETRRLAWEESARGARMQPTTPYSGENLQQAAAQIFMMG